MAYDFQVTVDSTDPHPLADWWAETLGWTREPQDPAFIRSVIDRGWATEEDTTTHAGALVWKAGAAIVHPENGRRVLFQLVPEPRAGKNRVHLDLRVDDNVGVRAALEARGATFLHEGRQGPQTWFTMADPQGNEFCLTWIP
jgi:hypothetical protein